MSKKLSDRKLYDKITKKEKSGFEKKIYLEEAEKPVKYYICKKYEGHYI